MSQNFPNITGEDYIDSGILSLQDRDNAVLTWFGGETTPVNPFEDLVWNDTNSKCIKWYHDDDWETIIDYGQNYITVSNLAYSYQPLNSNLTDYSEVSISGTGFITNEWIPISSFFINKLWSGFKDNIELGSLAYKSSLTQNDIADGCISMSKLATSVSTDPVFKVGDVIPSFNSGNKAGCVKLSKTANTVFTVGANASNSTYKGDVYKNLYQFIWTNKFVAIYNSNGVAANKGGSWTADWNNNKRLELPHIDLPEANVPAVQKISSGSNVNYKITKSGYYEIMLIGGGGGAAASSAGTWGHQSACSGASGAGFKGTILLDKDNIINYTIGTAGKAGNTKWDWGWPPSEGGAGGNSVLKLNGSNLVTCAGGGGSTAGWERYSWTAGTGGSVTIHQANRFSNVTSVRGADGHGTNDATMMSVNGPFNTTNGKGGSAQAWGDNSTPKIEAGGVGYFTLTFLAPKEYGTTNSTVKTALDNMYNAITYFMKY